MKRFFSSIIITTGLVFSSSLAQAEQAQDLLSTNDNTEQSAEVLLQPSPVDTSSNMSTDWFSNWLSTANSSEREAAPATSVSTAEALRHSPCGSGVVLICITF
jgi:hypothetical protein